MSTLKNGVLLRNRKAESRPLMEVICSLLLFAPCLSALMISCCEYFLINVKLTPLCVFLVVNTLKEHRWFFNMQLLIGHGQVPTIMPEASKKLLVYR